MPFWKKKKDKDFPAPRTSVVNRDVEMPKQYLEGKTLPHSDMPEDSPHRAIRVATPASPSTDKAPPPVPERPAWTLGEAEVEKNPTLEKIGLIIGRPIGNGSCSTVKIAKSIKLQKDVAVKTIHKQKAPKEYLETFLPREMDLLKKLKHPNICEFIQALETSSKWYIVMELCVNGDLLTQMQIVKNVKLSYVAKWFWQISQAMGYCHGKGVAHRDLKCENILLDIDRNIKITDFGFARGDLKKKDGSVKMATTYCGSYAYASPEVLTAIPYDPFKADVWSMGVVLYVMSFKRLPFDDSNHKVLIKMVLAGPVFPKDHFEWITEEWKVFIMQLFNSEAKRPTIKEMEEDPWFKKHCMKEHRW